MTLPSATQLKHAALVLKVDELNQAMNDLNKSMQLETDTQAIEAMQLQLRTLRIALEKEEKALAAWSKAIDLLT